MSSVRRPKNKTAKKNSNISFRNKSNRKYYCDRRYRRNLKKKLNNSNLYQTPSVISGLSNFQRISCLHPVSASAMEAKGPGSWFWENYNNAMEWQSRHIAAFWRTRCATLEAENNHLLNCLESLMKQHNLDPSLSNLMDISPATTSKQVVDSPDVKPASSREMNSTTIAEHGSVDERAEEDGSEEEEFVFEINEDMLEFFAQSAKHKQELKKQRDAEQKEEEDAERAIKENLKLKFPKESMQQRRDEMARIYGPASSMILSMETAMQLSFDRFNDRYQPKPWPNIPLKL